MELIIEQLSSHNFNDIVVNTSYMATDIEKYFRDGRRWGVNLSYSFEGYLNSDGLQSTPLGSAAGIAKIQEKSGFFDETFVVVCGDAAIDVDLTEALLFHRKQKAVATIIAKEVPTSDVEKYGIVELDQALNVTGFQEKPAIAQAKSNLANVGIYIFEPEVINFVPKGCEFDIGNDLFPLLIKEGKKVAAYEGDFTWIDLGNLSDYFTASLEALNGTMPNLQLAGQELQPGVIVGSNCVIQTSAENMRGLIHIGSGTIIEPDVRISGPCIIGSNCHIESGANITHSIINDNLRLSNNMYLRNKILYNDFCISEHGEHWSLSDAGMDWLVSDTRISSAQRSSHPLSSFLIKSQPAKVYHFPHQ